LADLPAGERAAVSARVIEERDYGEIARSLGCSEMVVRKRVSRGLARLRAGLATR
jgi:RNA polymerase sigma-70 factor (ECF subfamily)